MLGTWKKQIARSTLLRRDSRWTEVLNNLGVIAARRGQKNARDYFEKSVQTDPSDPDYHFNLAVELYREGDSQGASRQLRELLAIYPDSEAKTFL